MDFDNLTEEEIKSIPYYGETKFNQFWYTLNFALGGPDSDAFGLGDGGMEMQLNMLYAFTCFMIIIHFMNMLIAIMGNTFAERSEVADQIMIKDHLRFVMDNWLLKDLAFDLPKIKYIICAF